MEKIAHIVVSTHDSLHPIRGGGALRTLKAAEEFKKRGHQVIIIAPTDGVGELSGIKTHWLHAPCKQRSQILSSLKFNVRLLRKFLQFARNTDMFFVHNTIAAVFLPCLKPFFHFRFVLDITDIHAEYLPVGKRNLVEKLLTPFLLRVEYWIIGSADRIIVETQAMRRLLAAKGIPSARVAVVYDGAEPEKIPCDKKPGSENRVIHLGTVDRQHGVEVFVRAMPFVLARRPETKFLIVGGGRELPNVRMLASSLNVSGSCVFTDHLSCEEARQWLRQAAIGVIPRQDFLPNRIVTTLKLYEYWAGRTAVVSSRLEGIAEIACDGQDILFYAPGDPEDFAAKILRLLESADLRGRIQEGGLKTVRQYRWGELVPRIVDWALS
jgi:glycosyltransferase involved in cell wall biosynthesis